MNKTSRSLEAILFILILATGAALRLAALPGAPPGPSAEEATHTRDAVLVLEGERPIYFVGEGDSAREPLYSYATALMMLVAGKSYLAARLTSALFGLALLVIVYAWVRIATQNRWLALATMAGLAASFWGVMVSRLAMRAIAFPVLYMAAAVMLRRGIYVEEDVEDDFLPLRYRPKAERGRWYWFALAGTLLGASFYTYPTAHVMWLVFPAFFIFLSLTQPGVIRQAWPGLGLMLGIAAALGTPLAIYLARNPAATYLSAVPDLLEPLLAGNWTPLQLALRRGLGIITVRGDWMWLYNIPGRPLLGPVLSLLFYLGVSVAVLSLIFPYRPARRGRSTYNDTFRITSANAFMLLTLAMGLVPVILQGVNRSMIHALGIQPTLYYFPALAVLWLAEWARRQVGESGVTAWWVAYAGVLIVVLATTINGYFTRWVNAPPVQEIYPADVSEDLPIAPGAAGFAFYPLGLTICQQPTSRAEGQAKWHNGNQAS